MKNIKESKEEFIYINHQKYIDLLEQTVKAISYCRDFVSKGCEIHNSNLPYWKALLGVDVQNMNNFDGKYSIYKKLYEERLKDTTPLDFF